MVNKEVFKEECNIVLAELNKAITNLENKLKKLEEKRESDKKAIQVKGYEVTEESELDELISSDVITSDEYYKYLDKLHKVQKEVTYKQKKEAIELALKYFKREQHNIWLNLEDSK